MNDSDADGCTALHLSAANGHLRAVERLLEQQPEMDSRTKKGETALFVAAEHGYGQVARLLLDAKASVTAANDKGESPLMAACKHGMTHVVDVLLAEAPTDEGKQEMLMLKTKGGNTALYFAAFGGHARVVRMLLHKMLDKSPEALDGPLKASVEGDHEAAARMLIASSTGDLSNPIAIACQRNSVQCLKALVEVARSDAPKVRRDQVVGALSKNLFSASGDSGHDGAALLLLGACVEFNQNLADAGANRSGDSNLSRAAGRGRSDLVHALLAAGAKDSRLKGRNTALMSACAQGMPDVVRILLRSGVPPSAVDVQDANGATALCMAAGNVAGAWETEHKDGPTDEATRLECVKLLLGAQPVNYVTSVDAGQNLKLQHARCALAMAQLCGFQTIVQCLKSAFREEKLRASVKQKVH